MQIHLGNKIKQLRLQKGITQEILAKTLNVSCQTVSKWETETSMPDIQLLPEIAVYFGCSLDELFDLSEQAQFERIENMLLMQESLSAENFQQTKNFLLEKLHGKEKRKDPLRLLASLFNHKADEFRKAAEFYAKQALELDPECKENHSNLLRAQEGTHSDWDLDNHSQRIAYYQQFVRKNPSYLRGYLYLLDELIRDHRLKEAAEICDTLGRLDNSCRIPFYRGKILWQNGNHREADSIWLKMLEDHSNDWLAFANMADAMAYSCRYDKAIYYYQKAQQLQPSPKYTDAQITAAHIYEIQGDYAKAIQSLKEQLKILKNEWNITEGVGIERIHEEIARLSQAALRH